MATAHQVSRSLRTSANKLAKVGSRAVAAAAEESVVIAPGIGGSMSFGGSRSYPLEAKIGKISNKGDTSSAIVFGSPAGAWAIKSFGRRGGYMIPKGGPMRYGTGLPLGDSARARASMKRGTSGDGRWDRVIDAAAEILDQELRDGAEEAFGG